MEEERGGGERRGRDRYTRGLQKQARGRERQRVAETGAWERGGALQRQARGTKGATSPTRPGVRHRTARSRMLPATPPCSSATSLSCTIAGGRRASEGASGAPTSSLLGPAGEAAVLKNASAPNTKSSLKPTSDAEWCPPDSASYKTHISARPAAGTRALARWRKGSPTDSDAVPGTQTHSRTSPQPLQQPPALVRLHAGKCEPRTMFAVARCAEMFVL